MYAEQALRDACIEFCERTEVVQTVDTFDVEAGQAEYDVGSPAQQQLCRVIRVTYGDTVLLPVAVDEVRSGAAMRAGVDTEVTAEAGTPTRYYQRVPGGSEIYLWPVPDVDATAALAVRAAFAPLRSATQVEDVLFNDWMREIVSGALSLLQIVPGQPFTNPTLAEYHRGVFHSGMNRATTQARRGFTRGALGVSHRPFA